MLIILALSLLPEVNVMRDGNVRDLRTEPKASCCASRVKDSRRLPALEDDSSLASDGFKNAASVYTALLACDGVPSRVQIFNK